ncbi:hypothetical protein ALC56_15273, partial [Trachymyrmex septentrionalis]
QNCIKMPHVLNTLFHLVSLATYSFTVYYTYNVLRFPEYKKFNNFDPGQNKYLTVWNLVSNILVSIILYKLIVSPFLR